MNEKFEMETNIWYSVIAAGNLMIFLPEKTKVVAMVIMGDHF